MQLSESQRGLNDVLDQLERAIAGSLKGRLHPWRVAVAVVTAVGVVWLAIEPLGAFGLPEEHLPRGLVGYGLLILCGGSLGALSELARAQVARNRAEQELSDATALLRHYLSPDAAAGSSTSEVTDVLRLAAMTYRRDVESVDPAPEASRLTSYRMEPLLQFLADMQLGQLRDGQFSCRSELAACFLKSLAASLDQELGLLGGWECEPTDPLVKPARKLVLQLEKRRQKLLAPVDCPPIRYASSALALIKAHCDSESVFLLQQSPAWGRTYYWFIGGVMEDSDRGNPEACIRRELQEELGLLGPDITAVGRLTTVRDMRISKRLGALTEYRYDLFSVALDVRRPTVRRMLKKEFSVVTQEGIAKLDRRNRWHTWEEVERIPELQEDAPTLLEAIRQLEPDSLPTSFGEQVRG